MLRLTARRFPLGALHRSRLSSSLFSTDTCSTQSSSTGSPAVSHSSQPLSQPDQQQQHQGTTAAAPEAPPQGPSASAAAMGSEKGRYKGSAKEGEGTYQEEKERVLRAALGHVMKLGWSESALIAGARDVGVSPSIVGTFPRKEAAIVEFFMDECLEKLMDEVDREEFDLSNLILSKRLSKILRLRLEMQAPYISKWAQALSIQAQPVNMPTSLKKRATLIDEIWHVVGDQTSDINWYIKRVVLGGIYSTSEVYMLTDNSPDFQDTWAFMDQRIKDAFDMQKTVQEAAYLAEAIGVGIGRRTRDLTEGFLGGFKF